MFGRIEKAQRNLLSFLDEPVFRQPRYRDRGVVWPDGAIVVAHRIVGVHVSGQCSHTESRIQPGTNEMRCYSGGLVVVDDAGPQAVPHVRRDRVDLMFGAVERQRKRLLLRASRTQG